MIYIIQCGDTVKVGSSDDPTARLRELQTGNPVPLKMIAMLIVNLMDSLIKQLEAVN